jgi:hypothetical protein
VETAVERNELQVTMFPLFLVVIGEQWFGSADGPGAEIRLASDVAVILLS